MTPGNNLAFYILGLILLFHDFTLMLCIVVVSRFAQGGAEDEKNVFLAKPERQTGHIPSHY